MDPLGRSRVGAGPPRYTHYTCICIYTALQVPWTMHALSVDHGAPGAFGDSNLELLKTSVLPHHARALENSEKYRQL